MAEGGESNSSDSKNSLEFEDVVTHYRRVDDQGTEKGVKTWLEHSLERPGKIRVNVVGCFGQGKTTLTRRLLGADNLDECSRITTGVEIKTVNQGCVWEDKNINLGIPDDSSENDERKSHTPIKCDAEEKNFLDDIPKAERVTVWDFAGQYVYYATHQLFHSRAAIYLLVVDLSRSLDSIVVDEEFPPNQKYGKTLEDYIQFWLSSIATFVGSRNGKEPTVILVGTHKDKLSSEKEARDYLDRIQERFSGDNLRLHLHHENFATSLLDKCDENIEHLRKTILKIGRKQNDSSHEPFNWILLEQALENHQRDEIISFDKVLEIDSKTLAPIGNVDEIKECLRFCQDKGTCLYLDEGYMSQYVVVNPAFLIDAFRCIISPSSHLRRSASLRPLWKKLYKEAVLDEGLLKQVWTETKMIQHREVILGYLKHFRIVAERQQFSGDWRIEPVGQFIIPSLYRRADDGEIISFLIGKRTTQVSLIYKFESEIPALTLYHRVTAVAIGTWPVIRFRNNLLLYENAGAYKLNHSHAGLIWTSTNKIELLVISLCIEDDISTRTSNYFRGFVELIIGQELNRLRASGADTDEPLPFSERLRCYDTSHDSKGSVDTYGIDELKVVQRKSNRLCCPDHVSHASLSIDRIVQEWFDYKVNEREEHVPEVKLTESELCILSKAIGSEWEHLGAELGLENVPIQHIKMDNQTTLDRIRKMLLLWDRQFADRATLDVLVRALYATPPYSVDWDTVNSFIQTKRQ